MQHWNFKATIQKQNKNHKNSNKIKTPKNTHFKYKNVFLYFGFRQFGLKCDKSQFTNKKKKTEYIHSTNRTKTHTKWKDFFRKMNLFKHEQTQTKTKTNYSSTNTHIHKTVHRIVMRAHPMTRWLTDINLLYIISSRLIDKTDKKSNFNSIFFLYWTKRTHAFFFIFLKKRFCTDKIYLFRFSIIVI